jgi:hypothetical protein
MYIKISLLYKKYFNLMPLSLLSFILAELFLSMSKRDLIVRRPVAWRIATMDNGAIIYNRDPPEDSVPNE